MFMCAVRFAICLYMSFVTMKHKIGTKKHASSERQLHVLQVTVIELSIPVAACKTKWQLHHDEQLNIFELQYDFHFARCYVSSGPLRLVHEPADVGG